MASFHSRAGTLVRLSNDCRRASRTNPSQEFNNGVVISADPLNNNQLLVSSGVPTLDGTLGGGIIVGSVFLVGKYLK